ncbi:MAG: cobalamin-dependent protein, partial [Opitutaceae bacterium]
MNSNRYNQPYPVYPLGLAYLRAALVEAGHECAVWDALASEVSLEESIRSFRPDYVGLTVRNVDNVQSHNPKSFIHELLDFCSRIRRTCRAKLVLGGSGFSVFPREIFALARPDFGIAGEGELSFVELIGALG